MDRKDLAAYKMAVLMKMLLERHPELFLKEPANTWNADYWKHKEALWESLRFLSMEIANAVTIITGETPLPLLAPPMEDEVQAHAAG